MLRNFPGGFRHGSFGRGLEMGVIAVALLVAAGVASVTAPLGGSGGPVTASGAPAPVGAPRVVSHVAAPASIPANCATDVHAALRTWLDTLPADSTWAPAPGTCYQVDGGMQLDFPQGLTIDGGTFVDDTSRPPVQIGAHADLGQSVFDVIGGSDVTIENVSIVGRNPGGYHPGLAFEGGIELQGTTGATISDVSISHTFGDGITLAPLRGGVDHESGTILNPVEDLTVSNVSMQGTGRQGISPVSVDGATFTNVSIQGAADNAWDFEADQGNEGATNVVVNGCTYTGDINVSMAGGQTGPITFENCTTPRPTVGSAVIFHANGAPDKGEILFDHDTMRCYASVYVGCFQLEGAQNLVVENSTVTVGSPATVIHEAFALADGNTHAVFLDDDVAGYGRMGNTHPDSTVTVQGGVWQPARCGWPNMCPLP